MGRIVTRTFGVPGNWRGRLAGPTQTVIKELMASCKGKAPGWGGGARTRCRNNVSRVLSLSLHLLVLPGVSCRARASHTVAGAQIVFAE